MTGRFSIYELAHHLGCEKDLFCLDDSQDYTTKKQRVELTMMNNEEHHQSSPTPASQKTGCTANDAASSPLPSHTRHDSISRKRTNDDVYRPVETPKASPRSARFHLSRSQPGSPTVLGSQGTTTASGLKASPSTMARIPQPEFGRDHSVSGQSSVGFAQEIQDYEKRLEQEFQGFERSLKDRDPTAELEPLDWNELEARYQKEIKPHLDTEQEIMTEFSTRFQVGFANPSFGHDD